MLNKKWIDQKSSVSSISRNFEKKPLSLKACNFKFSICLVQYIFSCCVASMNEVDQNNHICPDINSNSHTKNPKLNLHVKPIVFSRYFCNCWNFLLVNEFRGGYLNHATLICWGFRKALFGLSGSYSIVKCFRNHFVKLNIIPKTSNL